MHQTLPATLLALGRVITTPARASKIVFSSTSQADFRLGEDDQAIRDGLGFVRAALGWDGPRRIKDATKRGWAPRLPKQAQTPYLIGTGGFFSGRVH